MKKRPAASKLLIILLLAAIPACAACGSREKEAEQPKQVILEPGLQLDEPDKPTPDTPAPQPQPEPQPEPEPEPPAEEEFIDLGRASTLDDLMANKERIDSYYFEQTVHAFGGDIFIKTWYKSGWMKIISSFPDAPENIEYFDCVNLIVIFHTPASGDNAMMMTFEAGDPDLPDNPLDHDYHQYRVLDTESINGQICRVLESRTGEKLWISTKHGFPLQMEYTDPTNDEHLIVTYENATFNQVLDEDVALPEYLIIYEF